MNQENAIKVWSLQRTKKQAVIATQDPMKENTM